MFFLELNESFQDLPLRERGPLADVLLRLDSHSYRYHAKVQSYMVYRAFAYYFTDRNPHLIQHPDLLELLCVVGYRRIRERVMADSAPDHSERAVSRMQRAIRAYESKKARRIARQHVPRKSFFARMAYAQALLKELRRCTETEWEEALKALFVQRYD